MQSLALIEISNLSPSLLVADRCVKTTNVRIVAIESTDGQMQCIKLLGSPSDVTEATEQGVAIAKQMGAQAFYTVLSRPID